MILNVSIFRTDGGVSSHVVAVVETDKGQVGHMRGKGQDEQDSHHAGHPRSPQAQCPEEGGGAVRTETTDTFQFSCKHISIFYRRTNYNIWNTFFRAHLTQHR